jgi:hypothetical protein
MFCRFPVLLRVLALLALSLWPNWALAQQPPAVAAIDAILELPEMQRTAILEQVSSRERVRLVLRLATLKLDQAKLIAASNPSEALAEIENYNNLIKYANLYISSILETQRERKMLFKSLEVTLREHLIGLKECEQTLGEPYQSVMEPAITQAQHLRTEALNNLFGTNVLDPSKR